jgi:DNA-binding NarL/FixJ family response regulator
MAPEPPIRVMVVDSSPVVRAGVASLLSEDGDIAVVATADSSARAQDLHTELDLDVVVTDLAALEIDADTATAGWFERCPGTKVVVLTDRIDEVLVRALLAAGVSACLLLDTVSRHELVGAIRGVMRGQATLSSEFLPHLVRPDHQELPGTKLTAREKDILELLVEGRTNGSIAHDLGLATGTVRIYVSGILTKLGTPNRTAATAFAIREGLLDLTTGSRGDVLASGRAS